MSEKMARRGFLKSCAALTGGALMSGRKPRVLGPVSAAVRDQRQLLQIDPEPRFELSPYLYMQFMEPLGTTDGSVDAAWDFLRNDWRPDVVDITRELAPTLMRWGGCFISYYRWKEGVGPQNLRKPMINLLWGGIYNNQVGTAEFVDFCRRVGADPLMCVNFESDGRKRWKVDPFGSVRTAGPEEAAEWVDYCNNPSNRERIGHGRKKTLDIKLWQIGNETSYDPDSIDVETAARRTLAFAKAMRRSDPSIEIIGWGENGWAKRMYEIAGEELQYLAFHNGFGPGGEDSPLRGIEYRRDWDRTWHYFMNAYKMPEGRILEMKEQVRDLDIPLAITEAHFFLPGRNRCEALSTWAAGVSNARILHVYERNGDKIEIGTLADFCGTRWQNNAVMIPTPLGSGKAFLMPVAMVMGLYRRHTGRNIVSVMSAPANLDITASRTGNRLFLHVINTHRTRSVLSRVSVKGKNILSGRVFGIALDPAYEVFEYKPEVTSPKESFIPESGEWSFPAASVSAVELDIAGSV